MPVIFRNTQLVTLGTLVALPWLISPAHAGPSITTGNSSVFIPFVNAAADGGPLSASPVIEVGFNGGTQNGFTMDTGSTGIVVTSDNFTKPPGQTPIGTGSVTYTSSGVVLQGHYYTTQVDIGSGSHAATATVPVLLVDSRTCVANARDCSPSDNPTGTAMFGIGFGQEAAGQPFGTPDKNAFLNVTAVPGGGALPTRGYVVTSAGVFLGLTAADTQGFNLMTLSYDSTYSDWQRAGVSVIVAGSTGRGTVLNDTGVSYMYLTPPSGSDVPTIATADALAPCVQFGPCAAPGTVIEINIGNAGETPAASYSFTIGSSNDGAPAPGTPAAPDNVTVLDPSTDVFVNTSYHFFNQFDYIYDYADGLVGFQSTGIPAPNSSGILAAGFLGLAALRRKFRGAVL